MKCLSCLQLEQKLQHQRESNKRTLDSYHKLMDDNQKLAKANKEVIEVARTFQKIIKDFEPEFSKVYEENIALKKELGIEVKENGTEKLQPEA